MEILTADKLYGELPIGILVNSSLVKEYRLLRANGIAEKVYTDKNNAKPYTWMAQVISVSVDSFGSIPVAGKIREHYSKTGGSIEIPEIVRNLTLQDANSLIVEIHRKLWKNLIRNQNQVCANCGLDFIFDVDMNEFKLDDESKLALNWHDVVIELEHGFDFKGIPILNSSEVRWADHADLYKIFRFRAATLGDAINNEREKDNIMFWRRIAFDCLQSVSTTITGGNELPRDVLNVLNLKLMDELLEASDLRNIRTTLRDKPPVIEYAYNVECPHCKLDTPITMGVSDFFGD